MASELLLEKSSYTKKLLMYKDLWNCMREIVYGSNRKYETVSLIKRTMVKYVGHFLEISYLGSWTDAQQSETH